MTQTERLDKLLNLFIQLKAIFEREDEIYRFHGISIAIECLQSFDPAPDRLREVRSIVQSMSRSINGLFDVGIWREDESERFRLNAELGRVRDGISALLAD